MNPKKPETLDITSNPNSLESRISPGEEEIQTTRERFGWFRMKKARNYSTGYENEVHDIEQGQVIRHDGSNLSPSSSMRSVANTGNISADMSASSSRISSYSSTGSEYTYERTPKAYFHRFIDSFKPFDYSQFPMYAVATSNSMISHDITTDQDPRLNPGDPSNTQKESPESASKNELAPAEFDYARLSELEKAAIVTSTAPLSKDLNARHLGLISLGGAIGTGLFIGTGECLAAAGPFGMLIVWCFVFAAVMPTMASLAELATAFPVLGAFVTFNTLFVDSSFGFAIAWNYALQWLITFPLELVAASITIEYWETDIHPAIFVTVFYIVIVVVNLFGVKGYGEVESALSIMKIIAVVGFIILSIIMVCGAAGRNRTFIGGSNWHQPQGGMFNEVNPFKNMCYSISPTAFAFAGIELFGLAACETSNPRKSIPKAMKQVFWRLFLFYIISIVMIGLLVSYKDPALIKLGSDSKLTNSGVDIKVSPFVIAIKNAEIQVLPSIFNVVIIITVLAVGNASVYGASRTLAALGALKQGPSILAYVDRAGRPIVALLVQFIMGLLCYLVALPGPLQTKNVFNWMLSLSGVSALFTYISICICHIRFRAALNFQARVASEELAYAAPLGCSWYGLISISVILVLQFWAALFPPGNGGKADAVGFLQIYLGLIVLIASYIGHKIYIKIRFGYPLTKLWLKASEIDVNNGRRNIDLDVIKQEMAEAEYERTKKNIFIRMYNILC